MEKGNKQSDFENLPVCAADYIRLVIKKMRWRRKASADVQAELIGHFEDALKDCKTDEEKEKKAAELIADFGDAEMLAVLARRAKKRCRPLWIKAIIKTFQATGIMICLSSLYVFWFLTGKPQITTDYIAVANKLARPAVADDSQNAAPLYEEAAKLIEFQEKEVKFEAIRKDFSEANEIDIAQIRQWLDRNSQALNLIAQGTDMPYYWQTLRTNEPNNNSLWSALLPNLSEYRTLARGLKWRAYLSAEDGQYQKAFADLFVLYKFGKHQKGKKTIIENLVGMAIEHISMDTCRTILSRHKIPAEYPFSFSNNLQSVVAGEDFTMAPSFEFEKLFVYDEIQRCYVEGPFGFDHLYMKGLSEVIVLFGNSDQPPKTQEIFAKIWFSYSNKEQTRNATDRYYDFWKMTSAETPYALKVRNLQAEVEQIIKGNLLLQILAPAMEKIITLSWRNRANAEATLAVIAIQRFKQEKEQLPDDLQEVVSAGYLTSLPMDPFSDKPLVYKKTENDFTLYSLGFDFDNDGGKMGDAKGGRPSIWNADDGDAVFWPVAESKK